MKGTHRYTHIDAKISNFIHRKFATLNHESDLKSQKSDKVLHEIEYEAMALPKSSKETA